MSFLGGSSTFHGTGTIIAIESKRKGRTFVRLSIRPDAAPMSVHNSLNDRQAYSGSLEFFAPMQALKNAEQLTGELHVKADPIVLDIVCSIAGGASPVTA